MTRRVGGIAPGVLLLILAATGAAQSDTTDDFLLAEMKRQRIPGLSLAVVRDGKVVKAAGYGLADIARKMPATPETVYKIASVSKQFVAAGIMCLVQEGRLDVADPVSKYLDGTPAAWKGITVRHLLTHTAGLIREAPGFDPFKIQSDAAVIRTVYSVPLRFAPGEKFEYGNVAYFALAEIISKVSGRPWTEYIDDKILKPAGMRRTWPTNTKATVPDRAVGYVDNDTHRVADDWPALRPSGAFLSTVLDLARWDAALYADAILSESSRRQMWTPVALNDGKTSPYGFGWQLGSVNGRPFVQHTGGMPGARAGFTRFPDDRVTIIVLMNLDDVDIESILVGLIKIHLPRRA